MHQCRELHVCPSRIPSINDFLPCSTARALLIAMSPVQNPPHYFGFANDLTVLYQSVSLDLFLDAFHAYLNESNVGRLLTEALTADVETVLPDKTSLVCADTAIASQYTILSFLFCFPAFAYCRRQRGKRTKLWRPFRRCADASSRQSRET